MLYPSPARARHALPALLLLAAAAVLAACGPSDSQPPPEPPVPPAPPLGMNDVSVLYPLPADPGVPGYLGPLSAGSLGELLPESVYDAIPLFPVKPSQGLDYQRMRTVALRFDGCQQKPSGCQAQIRLVMQPINTSGAALDSALHLFYELDDARFAELVGELRQLHTLAPELVEGAPLDVHPALLAQGVLGPYGAALKELVLRYAGEQNLTRMTFFLRAPPVQQVWFFGGFERIDGALEAMTIVGVPANGTQRVILADGEMGWSYDLTPLAPMPEDGSVLLSDTSAQAASAAEREAAFASFLRVENPHHYAPDALPCAGCHLSAFVSAQVRAMFQLEDSAFPNDAFSSERNLSMLGGSQQTKSSLRAFGWFDKQPMISQRVINESAAVLDDIDVRYPATIE